MVSVNRFLVLGMVLAAFDIVGGALVMVLAGFLLKRFEEIGLAPWLSAPLIIVGWTIARFNVIELGNKWLVEATMQHSLAESRIKLYQHLSAARHPTDLYVAGSLFAWIAVRNDVFENTPIWVSGVVAASGFVVLIIGLVGWNRNLKSFVLRNASSFR